MTYFIKKQVQSIDNCSGNWFVCDLKTKSSYRELPICDVVLYNELKKYHDEVSKFKNYSDKFFIFGPDSGISHMFKNDFDNVSSTFNRLNKSFLALLK